MGKITLRNLVAVIAAFCGLGYPAPAANADALHQGIEQSNRSGILGSPQRYRVKENESLFEVARKFDVGINAVVAANPKADPWIPPAGSLIDIPTFWILPDLPTGSGIVVNIPELRLYFFPKKRSRSVATFPLGIGNQGRDTPTGGYLVIEKIINPAWHVPKSIRAESPHLPKVVPPGPDNPLGSHALRLSLSSVLIHGTNKPWGIGRRSSHGCLRLYPEDIVKLFKLVAKGTRVTIVDQPIKACTQEGRVFVEVHRQESKAADVGRALHLLATKNLVARTDFTKLIRAIEEMKGVPVDVTLVP